MGVKTVSCVERRTYVKSNRLYTPKYVQSKIVIIHEPWHAVTQLVETLPYKPDGRGLDSCWFHWNFLLTKSFRLHYDPLVDQASNRMGYQEYFMEVKSSQFLGLTLLPHLWVDCLEIREPQSPGTLWACNRPVQGWLFCLYPQGEVNTKEYSTLTL